MESPGTAPGSEPIITGAFIAIVGVAPDKANIGPGNGRRKGAVHAGRIHGAWKIKGLAVGVQDPITMIVNVACMCPA